MRRLSTSFHYGLALLSTAVVTLASLAFAPILGDTPSVLYIGAVVVSAWYGGLGPGLLATGLSTLLSGFFVSPLSLNLQTPLAFVYPAGLLAVQLLITCLTGLLRRDVGHRERAQAALQRLYANLQETERARDRLEAIIEATTDFVAVTDASGVRVYLNPAGRELLGLAADADISRGRLDDDRPQWARDQFLNEILPVADSEGIWSGESAYLNADGREIPVSKVVLAHKAADGTNIFYSTVARDITKRKQFEQEIERRARELAEANVVLQEQAQTDTLTGLPNRAHSVEVLDKFMSLAKRQDRPLSLAFLDVDHFKLVNDRYGHLVGDAVLSHLGELLVRSFRGEDVVARWGGEEFIVGMFGTAKPDAVKRLELVLGRFRDDTFTAPDGQPFHVTCSAGVAEYPIDALDVTELHEVADKALYQAKEAGRDRIVAVS